MKVSFATIETQTTIISKDFTLQQLTLIIKNEKPAQIYHGLWSTTTPFIIISEYLKNGDFLMMCNGCSEKEPDRMSIKELYKFLLIQGISNCYFEK